MGLRVPALYFVFPFFQHCGLKPEINLFMLPVRGGLLKILSFMGCCTFIIHSTLLEHVKVLPNSLIVRLTRGAVL